MSNSPPPTATACYGVAGGTGQGGSHMPFARAVAADGWLYVSGQVPMENGEVIEGGTVAQSHKAIQQVLAILKEAGYGPEHVRWCGWTTRATFRRSTRCSREYFGETARAPACSRRDGGRQGRDRLCGGVRASLRGRAATGGAGSARLGDASARASTSSKNGPTNFVFVWVALPTSVYI